MRDLKWKGVSVPSQSLSLGAGKPAGIRDEIDETEGDEDDPFADLDEGADDFMGLQEVSGVGVRYQGDEKTGRKVEFYTKSDAKSQPSQPAASATVPKVKSSDASAMNGKTKSKSKAGQTVEKAPGAAPAAAAAPTSGLTQDGDDMEVDEDEEEEWKPVASDDEQDDEAAESVADMFDKADADETIPEGIFSSFAGELPEDDDGVDGGESFARVSFDGEWPGQTSVCICVSSS